MKKILLTLTLALLVTASFAQRKRSSAAKLGIGLDFGVPIGDFADIHSIGFGGAGKAELPLSSNFFFTVTAGYISYYYDKPVRDAIKAVGGDTYLGFVPLKAGGKYYFSPNFYGEGEIGARIGTNKGTGTAFVYAPGLGFSFPVSNGHDIDFGARFEGWTVDANAQQFVFRIAYKFGL
ncbi:hypothetical protein [Mucilaginibacter aquatilis]|uniref:Outer membrane protein beta-barrel domain-containing protein n=1 Tax=Mucilaginibacter aquatilis TaxID=1517760 RepID=A0A6I4IBR8_9SPHI|nr:hypothetical protein [Mucilaginibacter aquatilis]MVN90869.1 hypothetical protein [Mucilaginibacter aquatilis]